MTVSKSLQCVVQGNGNFSSPLTFSDTLHSYKLNFTYVPYSTIKKISLKIIRFKYLLVLFEIKNWLLFEN